MKRQRRSYTHGEAQRVLVNWLTERGMSSTTFQRWLSERGIEITRAYCDAMTKQKLSPGPKFKQVFREITGIQLVDGLIEKDRA